MEKTAATVPAPPKRPQNGFFRYKDKVYQDTKDKNPDLKITEITKLISEGYRNLPDKEKTEYETNYKADLEAWKIAAKAHEDKYGKAEKKERKKKGKKTDEKPEKPADKSKGKKKEVKEEKPKKEKKTAKESKAKVA